MSTGAHGVISVASNVAPEKMVSLVENLQAGSSTNAASIHHRLASLIQKLFYREQSDTCKGSSESAGFDTKCTQATPIQGSGNHCQTDQ
jgi:4-hydroxy-tetrahydrodipicolinate synthase